MYSDVFVTFWDLLKCVPIIIMVVINKRLEAELWNFLDTDALVCRR